MNILFAGNDAVFDGILSCMLSILKRTTSKEPFSIYVLTMDVSHIKPDIFSLKTVKFPFLTGLLRKYHRKTKFPNLM